MAATAPEHGLDDGRTLANEALVALGGDVDELDAALDEAIPTSALLLARAFARGATLWCVAPQWPEHARHLAVEFVHPVIVGTRALPAVSVAATDPVAALRPSVDPGDVVAVLGTADHEGTADLLQRAGTWGATTLWIATGDGGRDVRADAVIRIEDREGTAPYDGRLVLRYHLLWELTHICFEHPGHLRTGPEEVGEVCTTCRDEGRLAEVVRADASGSEVEVRTARGREQVDATLVDRLAPDDLVLVHGGSVIARVGPS